VISAPKGTQDILPAKVHAWQHIEAAMRCRCVLSGYGEIRTPVFESTELFARGVGDTTDIVQKEMYTFEDRGGRSVTLKPEGTAGVVRALVEHGLLNEALPIKVFYAFSPTFRYERPQSGRLREHHQFGVECFGAPGPGVDAEIIALGAGLLADLGLSASVELQLNSIGCPVCRAQYLQVLQGLLTEKQSDLCGDCVRRLQRNPLRALDCKNQRCQPSLAGLPHIVQHICGDCAAHFEGLQNHLTDIGISFTINPRIVRGLDYYTRTVFEFVSPLLGAQSTVCGGGRYDGLVASLGGPAVSGIGFGLGMERLLLMMEAAGSLPEQQGLLDVFVACVSEGERREALKLTQQLREKGIKTDCDHANRSVKAQFKYAGKLSARYVITLGPEELAVGKAQVRDMAAHTTENIFMDKLGEYLCQLI